MVLFFSTGELLWQTWRGTPRSIQIFQEVS